MKRLVILCIGIIILLSACQAPEPTQSVQLPTEPAPSETPAPPAAATKAPTEPLPSEPTATTEPSPSPTQSLEEKYGIPEGWVLYPAERLEEFFKPELTGFAFALSPEWTCEDARERLSIPYECILDKSADRFENRYKTRLQFLNINVIDGGAISIEELSDFSDFTNTYGHACEVAYFTIAGLDASTVTCTHPGFDETLDFANNREAYEDALQKLPQVTLFINNGLRIEQFWLETWTTSHLALIQEYIPYMLYGVEELPGIRISE